MQDNWGRYDDELQTGGRLVKRTDAMGHSVKFRYDAYGRLLQLTNENEKSYTFGWDKLDRLVAQRDLDGSGRIPQAHLTLQRSITADAPSTDSTAQTMSSVAPYSWPSGDSEAEYDDEGFYEDSDGELEVSYQSGDRPPK